MVSKIRELCKQNKTSIAALERQLGFGNGVIGRWDKSAPNYDRLCAVADALGVSVSELTDSESKKNTAVPQDDGNNVRIDYQAGRIRSAHPVAILAAQYSVPSAVMQSIAECDLIHAQALCIGLSDPTPEELKKIAQVFRVSLDDLSQGWVSLSTNQGVHDDIVLRRSYRFPEQERSE